MGGKLVGPVNYYANVNFSDQEGWRDNGNRRFSGYLALQAKMTERDILDVRGGFNCDFYGTEIGLPDLWQMMYIMCKQDSYISIKMICYRDLTVRLATITSPTL